MTPSLPTFRHPVHDFGVRTLDFSRQVALMSILNRTPDSFYDGGANLELSRAIAASEQAVAQGAHWIDIGGAPFKPGPAIAVSEEIERVVPLVKAVRERTDVIISVDTFQPEVARQALEAGANVINDTTGLAYPELAGVVAEFGAHVVITHSLAEPRTSYPKPHYHDIVREIIDFWEQKISLARSYGVQEEHILLDPGHDLNKNTLHTLELTRRFHEFTELGFPLLAAVSNKDFIGESLDLPKEERVTGSLVAATWCISQGARIIRMHNVRQASHTIAMCEAIMGLSQPAYLKHNMGDFNV